MYIRKLLVALSAVIAMITTSCRETVSNDIYDYISSDNLMVASVNIHDIAINAGAQYGDDGVRLSEAVRMLLGRSDASYLESVLAVKGYDSDHIIVLADSVDGALPDFVVLARITDAEIFTKTLADCDYQDITKKDGLSIISNDTNNTCVVIAGDVALLLDGAPSEMPGKVESLITKAQKHPIEDWRRDRLGDPVTLTMITSVSRLLDYCDMMFGSGRQIVQDVYGQAAADAMVVLSAELKGMALTTTLKLYGNDGSLVPSQLQPGQEIATLARYFGINHIDGENPVRINTTFGIAMYLRMSDGKLLVSTAEDNFLLPFGIETEISVSADTIRCILRITGADGQMIDYVLNSFFAM